MNTLYTSRITGWLQQLVAVFVLSMVACGVSMAQTMPTKIGIIGTGNIGGGLARHWANAGYELVISSRHPEELEALAAELGDKVRTGTPREAAAFGEVVVVSVPYAATPQIGTDFAEELKGKVILDTGNPFERRDGPMAVDALAKGVGIASQEFLKGTHVVRAYNCIPFRSLADDANREPERVAIPIAGDDAAALEVAKKLVMDTGFDPVVVGSLAQSGVFELGQPLASGQFTAKEMRAKMEELGL